MPVGTNATVKALHPDDLREVGATIILANTYHLYLRPGHERIRDLGGLHRFMAWDRPILTDSGGFQVVSLERPARRRRRRRRRSGATSTARSTGSPRSTRSRSRRRSEPDVAVAFDQPVSPARRRARSSRTRPRGPIAGRSARWLPTGRPDQALFGVIQGGLDPDLREESTRFIAGLPFDGICIGGLAGDETPEQREAALDVAVPAPRRRPRPRYLMGLGSPADLLEAVHRGIDLFDSVLPGAGRPDRPGLGPGGRLNLRNAAVPGRSRSRSRTAVRASPAGRSRGPTSPICSGPRSSSRTGSRLVTT